MNTPISKAPDSAFKSSLPIAITGSDLEGRNMLHLLQTILKLAVEMMNADRGIILRSENGNLNWVASFPESHSDAPATEVSSSAVNQVLASGFPLLMHDAQADPRFGQAASVILHQITSIICVPMYFEDRMMGVIYLDSRSNRQSFTDENVNFVSTFGQMAAIALNYAFGYHEVLAEKERLQRDLLWQWEDFKEIVGKSPKMSEVFNLVRRIMNSDISVLLEGESGTGKELVARALHYSGPRRDKPFVAQFCGNLAEALLESELFGHKKGSFTGAISDKKGLFEVADGGTFFLDEIADISPTIQSKLLRVLQEGEIRRVGDTESRMVTVRLISATNKNLRAEVDAGKFREDLFYRLNVITIHLPPLRERTGDVPLLVKHFLSHFAEKNHTPIKKITPKAMQALEAYPWPGNVRELENTIERATILCEGDTIEVEDLFIPEGVRIPGGPKTLKEFERELVERTLKECDDNKTRAAEILGVSLRWMHYKLNEWKTPPTPAD